LTADLDGADGDLNRRAAGGRHGAGTAGEH
jgi:hypothetical protein